MSKCVTWTSAAWPAPPSLSTRCASAAAFVSLGEGRCEDLKPNLEDLDPILATRLTAVFVRDPIRERLFSPILLSSR